jgi:hypothetical protein
MNTNLTTKSIWALNQGCVVNFDQREIGGEQKQCTWKNWILKPKFLKLSIEIENILKLKAQMMMMMMYVDWIFPPFVFAIPQFLRTQH